MTSKERDQRAKGAAPTWVTPPRRGERCPRCHNLTSAEHIKHTVLRFMNNPPRGYLGWSGLRPDEGRRARARVTVEVEFLDDA